MTDRGRALIYFMVTAGAMVAMAANSVLGRFAVGGGLIDPTTFTSVRVVSGALLLYFLARREPADDPDRTDWVGAASLFVYLVAFSFAYLALEAGTGALILFGAVQLTMFAAGLAAGERFSAGSWTGFAIAVAGLVYLLAPGAAAPPLAGGLLMGVAGAAWGVYSLRGRKTRSALVSTARNFAAAAPLVIAVNALNARGFHVSLPGAAAAIASGTVSSALGYVLWYRALRRLSALSASTVQLSVPVIATVGGIAFLAESPTVRLAVASVAVLGGIALAIVRRPRAAPVPAEELRAP